MMASGEKERDPKLMQKTKHSNQRASKHLQTRRGCRSGKSRSFLHESEKTQKIPTNPQTPIDSHVVKRPQNEWYAWARMVPASVSTRQPLVQKLPRFFQLAWNLFSQGDIETRQQIITALASEGGLYRIQELTDFTLESADHDRRTPVFEDSISPLFRIISNEDVLSSLLLEKPIDTIYNFLFGPHGRRAIKLFEFIVTALPIIVLHSDKEPFLIHIEASSVVLQKIIDLNGTALILQEFKPIAQKISDYLGEDTPGFSGFSMQRAHGSLSRIQLRLDLGSAMSPAQMPPREVLVPLTRSEVSHDGPGLLSLQGPRHDNDHEEITEIKIMPTAEEVQSPRLEYRPLMDPETLHLPGIRGLLDRQFRLLREDTVGQLRDAVGLEIDRLRGIKQRRMALASATHVARTNVYHDVRLTDITLDKWKGLQILAEFNQPAALHDKSANQRQDWWIRSKRLQTDTLLCLVDSEGGVLFLSVAALARKNNPKDRLADGVLTNTNDKNLHPSQEPCTLSNNRRRAGLTLHLVDNNSSDIAQTMGYFTKRGHLQQSLVEFPGVLLPSFRPTLEALQQMSSIGELPFAEILAPPPDKKGKLEIPPPTYALRDHFSFDLSCLLSNGGNLRLSAAERFDFQALQRGSTLDEAQGTALVDALSRSLALIQGPPGTGKSFTGIALIKVLLKNRVKSSLGPIICVCYTNHALDQLLEHLVRDGIQRIIRLGSRSKSQLLEPLNLREVSKKQDKTRIEKSKEWELRTQLEERASEIQSLLSELRSIDSWRSVKAYLENNHTLHHNELFGDDVDDDGFRTVQHDSSKVINRWLRSKSKLVTHPQGVLRPVQSLFNAKLQDMNCDERQRLYQYWIADITQTVQDDLRSELVSFTKIRDTLNQTRQELNLRCLQQAHVVGVTTSGLANNIEVLRRLRSKVMICEEAGEVLEAHIVTALLPSIEHAILIGDHQQLRPQTQNYELKHDNPSGEKYSLDVSLFERLVDPENRWGVQVPYSVLEVQRRMYPSIAQLVRDTLYPKLQDHMSVKQHSEVSGLRRRLFWFDHRELENGSDPSQATSTSFSNDFEVEMTASLVSHLVRQGVYQSDDIAVLTPYLGQLYKLRRRMASSHEIILGDRDAEGLEKEGFELDANPPAKQNTPQRTTLLKALRVATVDNFQGEEAKVVVISLVRSNAGNNCGFLKTSNRVNVLLRYSRARNGMYIIGNAQTSRHVPMWAKVLSILKLNQNIGSSLPLRCSRHPETVMEVSTPDDFTKFAPEGGCNEKCNLRLSCGHSCVNRCHSDSLHSAVLCLEPCRKSKIGCDHPCPLPCGQPCEKMCNFKLANVALLCGHVRSHLECYKSQDLSKVRCDKQVKRLVPGCQHTVNVSCHIDVTQKSFQCGATCGAFLPCGHTCLRKCKDCNDKTGRQASKQMHGDCQSQCGRPYNNCAHQCVRQCHGEEPCSLCEAPCEVQCRHSKCNKKCSEPCAPCAQLCASSCPHRGQCQMPCAVPCDILPCSERCHERLSCGHRCPSICGEKCPLSDHCQVCGSEAVKGIMVDYILQSTYDDIDLDEDPVIVPSCGHLMARSSMDGHMGMSDYYYLSENSSISDLKPLPEPFTTENVKNCPMCRGSFRDINRYNRIVKQGLLEQATKKFISWANQQYLPLEREIYEEEKRLHESIDGFTPERQTDGKNLEIKLEKSPSNQIEMINRVLDLNARYKRSMNLKAKAARLLKQVNEEEQPFGRVFDMMRDIVRRRGVRANLTVSSSVLNTRYRMLVTLLSIRCNFCIIADFVLAVQKAKESAILHDWIDVVLHLDLSENRQACEAVVTEAISRDQPMLEVEARIFFVRWCTLERSVISIDSELSKILLQEAKQQVTAAEATCKSCPGQTKGLKKQLFEVSKMLRDTIFYTVVDDEEKRQVYAAMAAELRGTGHWYVCTNGHPFTVGECGMPMETSVCNQCGARIGGQNHQPTTGVAHAQDFENQFGRLRI